MATSHPSRSTLVTPPATPTPAPRLTANRTGSQGRFWCFTTNNYTANCLISLDALGNDPTVSYLVYGREVGESGTPHLQGFIMFITNKRFNAVRDILPFGSHVATRLAQSSNFAAAEYCKKDGDFFEFGTPPLPTARGSAGGAATAEKWRVAKAAAKRGALDEIADDLFIKYYSTFKRIQKDYMAKPDPLVSPCGLWIFGDTGTGKTHSVVTQHPNR